MKTYGGRQLLVLATIIIAFAFISDSAQARGKSSSRSSSKSYSSSSSSKSYSGSSGYKKSTSTYSSSSGYKKTSSSSGSTKSSYKKPSSSPGSTKSSYKKPPSNSSSTHSAVKKTASSISPSGSNPGESAPKSKFAAQMGKTLSYKALERDKAKFKIKSPPIQKDAYKSNPIYSKYSQKNRINKKPLTYQDYKASNRSYYYKRKFSMPSYAYGSRSSFGIWNAAALWLILDHLNDPNYYSMAYHHRNDPDFMEWRSEADSLALKNDELQEKLTLLDDRVEMMMGSPVNPGYLPEGMPEEVAMAPDMVVDFEHDKKYSLVIATGNISGYYSDFVLGNKSRKIHGLKHFAEDMSITCLNTSGSIENLKLFINGKADAIIAQFDVFLEFAKIFGTNRLGPYNTLYSEYIHVIVNNDSPIRSIKDINENNFIYIGPKNSGTAAAWRGLAGCNPKRYGSDRINIINSDFDTALKHVLADKNAVMMYISGLNTDFMQTLDTRFGKQLRFVLMDDDAFNANKSNEERTAIYGFKELPPNSYPNMQANSMMVFDGKIKLLTEYAVLLLSRSWAEEIQSHGRSYFDSALEKTLLESRQSLGM